MFSKDFFVHMDPHDTQQHAGPLAWFEPKYTVQKQ